MTKSEHTKRFIIEKVAHIFNKKGAYGTSLSDITKATGLTKGAVYGNFQDKDTLAEACFDHNLKFFQKGLYKAIATQGNAWHKLEMVFAFYEEGFPFVYANGGCALMNSAVEADDGYPLLKQRTRSTFENWQKEMEGVIREGQTTGEFSRTANPTSIARLIIGGIEGAILVAKSTQDMDSFPQTLNHLKTIIEKELK